MTLEQLLAEARRAVTEIDVAEAERRRLDGAVMLDVREPDETGQGAILGAMLVPRGLLETSAAGNLPKIDTPIVVNCASGTRSLLAAATLMQLGYSNVASLAGGFAAWKADGGSWSIPSGFGAEQRARYSRQLLLPEVGEAGQQRLLGSRVLIVGAGGLGSPAALYLAGAGVGTIGLADMDSVDLTNLQRQVIHDSLRLGWSKVSSAARSINALNPEVKVVEHDLRVDANNAKSLISDYDVIIDGADNFDARYALSDASADTGIPVVYGSVFRFEGQVTVFDPRQGFTYRNYMPTAPPASVAPNCSTAGVLGVLPGIIGTIQATEAIKLLLGIGRPLVGRMLVLDALEMDTTELRLQPAPD